MTIEVHTAAGLQPETEAVKAAPESKDDPNAKSAPVENTEQKLAATSEAAESEDKTENPESEATDETAKAGESDAEEAGTEEQEKPKKKGGFQRRIDKLNARYSEKEREVEYWKQQALKGAGESNKETEAPTQKSAAGDGKPNPDNFDSHAAYVEALTDWKTDQKLQERDQKAEQSRLEIEQKTVVKTYLERKAAFAEAHPDFEEVIEEVSDIPISPTITGIILNSENGPELAYELAKRPKEFARLCKLPPIAAAKELGKLEAEWIKPSESKKNTAKTTRAPAPVNPVSGGSKGSVQKTIYDAHTMSQKEYEAVREKQIQNARANARG